MRRLVGTLSVIVLGSAMAVGVPAPSSAATGEFGNSCVATVAPSGITLIMIAGAGTNPQPATAPSTGVITQARFNVPATPTTFPTVVKVLRATGVSNQYTVIAQSASVAVGGGLQTYPVRVPVRAGDVLGVFGTSGTLACSPTNAGDVIGQLAGDAAVGTTATYSTGTNAAVPLVATVEPDVDGDGFGDVTQDGCPQSAAFQGPCPAVVVRSLPTTRGSSITVLVTTNNAASVTVTGLAKVDGKKIKLKSRTTSVNPGDLAQIKVKLPRALKRALAGLPSRRSIKVTFTTSATDAIGRVTTSRSSVKLHGTGH